MGPWLLVVGLLACGDDDTTGPYGGDPAVRVVKEFPEFRADVMDIFVRNSCASDCHALGQGGLTIVESDPAATYGQLVNEPAHSESFLRVNPFDAENSYVVIKVEGRNSVGSPMPPGDALDSIDLANLRRWIDTGAPDN